MITFETYMGTVDMSCDVYKDRIGRMSFIYKSLDRRFLEDKMLLTELEFLGNIGRYMQLKNYPKPANARVLRAHGRTDNGYEFYEGLDDERRYVPVEKWIERNESAHDLLFIESCNSSRIMLHPREKTFLIHPLGIYMRMDLIIAINNEHDLGRITIVPPENLEERIRPSHRSL